MAEGVEKSILYQIYYKDEQKQHLFPFAKPVYNQRLTVFFENKIIVDVVQGSKAEKIGVCSWKLFQKLKLRVSGPNGRRPLTEEALNEDYEVLSFTRNTPAHRMIARADIWHAGFRPSIDKLWEKLGYKRPHETRSPIYQNHYMAKGEIYRDYVDNFLAPAIDVIQRDEELNNLMMQPSRYEDLVHPQKDGVEALKRDCGIDYYPMVPFVLERCPSLWFEMKKIKVSYL